ncbi:hypothetical protein SDC9_155585 [bioreactor metagenome]|uniref:Uncharacterized protein n=1 Tax=bioreactor metagenome TaxID=1076179 RepID=A0A645F748_9ZZZZ
MSLVTTSSPSLSTVTLSATFTISSSLWLIKIIPMPALASCFIALRRFAASLSVNTAVGSSNTSIFNPVLSISLAISINCIWPTGSPATIVYSSILISNLFNAFLVSLFIALKSRSSNCLPKILLAIFPFVISLLIFIFSVIVY